MTDRSLTGGSRRPRTLGALGVVIGLLALAAGLVLVWDGSGSTAERAPATGPATSAVPGARASSQVPGTAPSPVGAPGATRHGGVRPEVVVVPALDVRAPVSPIATEDGALTPPPDPQRLGWWSGGSLPGAGTGAAVLTGHTVHTGGGALDDLEALAVGARVVVQGGTEQVVYAVSEVQVLTRAELARRSPEIFGRTGPGRLVLITCEDWDGTAYLSNVVVTARPV